MSDRVYYYPNTDEIVVIELDETMAWFIIDYGDDRQVVEPSFLEHYGFIYLGEL